MNYKKLWNDLLTEARMDAEYLWHLEAVRKAEMDYLAVCETLNPEQRVVIEDYISACEELGDNMALIAYRLGK